MAYSENVNEIDTAGCVKVLTDVAEAINDCSKVVQESSEALAIHCNTPGTKGAVNKDILLAKVDDMKRVCVLYNVAAKLLTNTARKLEKGESKKEDLDKVFNYGLFFADQLESEIKDANIILAKLRG